MDRSLVWRALFLFIVLAAGALDGGPRLAAAGQAAVILALPAPRTDGSVSLERTLKERRSVRELTDKALTLDEVSQLLWAAQGVTHPRGLRTAPSAGATYPLEIYLVAGAVEDLETGIYRYLPDGHRLEHAADGDIRQALASAARGQDWMRPAAISIVIAAVEERTSRRYGKRAVRYVDNEVGAVVQNIQLQGTAMGLGSTFVGAFDDAAVKRVVGLKADEEALAIVPVGHVR